MADKILLLRDIAMGLVDLHSVAVLHGDIKPQNTLLSANKRINLADFGLASIIVTGKEYGASTVHQASRMRGMPVCLAPEIIEHISLIFLILYSFWSKCVCISRGRIRRSGVSINEYARIFYFGALYFIRKSPVPTHVLLNKPLLSCVYTHLTHLGYRVWYHMNEMGYDL